MLLTFFFLPDLVDVVGLLIIIYTFLLLVLIIVDVSLLKFVFSSIKFCSTSNNRKLLFFFIYSIIFCVY